MKDNVKMILIAVVLFSTAIYLAWIMSGSDQRAIHKWMAKKSITVTSISRQYISIGPYWIAKDYRIYKVKTSNGVYWIRFGRFFYPDIEIENNGGYKTLKW